MIQFSTSTAWIDFYRGSKFLGVNFYNFSLKLTDIPGIMAFEFRSDFMQRRRRDDQDSLWFIHLPVASNDLKKEV